MKKKSLAIDRSTALSTRPVRRAACKTEEKNGKRLVTVEFERPGWQKLLGADQLCKRTFGLDVYGQEVYDMCDGAMPVNRIVGNFAKLHQISVAEAELSVTAFLKTLISKGLVMVPLSREAVRGKIR